jgi:uncharacterized protein YyaL (SSP411 family)
MVNAAIALRQATGDGAYIVKARHFLEQLDLWHTDEAGTGYYLTASDSADVPIRVRGDVDEAMPSATAQIVEAIAKLANLTGDVPMHDKAWRIAEHAMGRIAVQPYGQAGTVSACALLQEPFKLMIVDNTQDSGLVAVANRNPDPRRVDIILPIGTKNPPELPGGALPPTDHAAAYLCRGQACLPAIMDANQLERELRGASAG